MSELFETLRSALEAAGRTSLGQKALSGHDEDFQVDVAGQGSFHVEISGGKLAVRPGPSPRQEPMHFTRIELDEKKRLDLYKQAQQIMYEDGAALFMYTLTDIYGVDNWVKWEPRKDEMIWAHEMDWNG